MTVCHTNDAYGFVVISSRRLQINFIVLSCLFLHFTLHYFVNLYSLCRLLLFFYFLTIIDFNIASHSWMCECVHPRIQRWCQCWLAKLCRQLKQLYPFAVIWSCYLFLTLFEML